MPIETTREFTSEQEYPSNGKLGDRDVQLSMYRKLSISFAEGDEKQVLDWLRSVTREFEQAITVKRKRNFE